MLIAATVSCSLKLEKGVEASFAAGLELSLDCAGCQRSRRTVIFVQDEDEGRCTPSGHAFDGKIVDCSCQETNDNSRTTVVSQYEVEYQFETFADVKEPDRVVAPGPKWGRVHFFLKCPKCGSEKQTSTQNNVVRPRKELCDCGVVLMVEEEEMPQFQWRRLDV